MVFIECTDINFLYNRSFLKKAYLVLIVEHSTAAEVGLPIFLIAPLRRSFLMYLPMDAVSPVNQYFFSPKMDHQSIVR